MKFDYLTHTGPGQCDLTVGMAGANPVAFVRDIPENPGTPVTNAMETIATLVYHRYFRPLGFGMNDITWITKDLDGVTSRAVMASGMGRYFIPTWVHESTEPIIQEFM